MDTKIIKVEEGGLRSEQLSCVGEILRGGGLVAFPTETVYGLGGNALDPHSAQRIYEAKGRPSDNPLIIHIADPDKLFEIAAEVPQQARKLADKYWPGPLTMIFKKKPIVPLSCTGGLETVAVRMPDHSLALELIRSGGGFVAAPSANVSGRPSPTSAKHVIEDLQGRIECIIDGGIAPIGLESTIVDFTEAVPVVLRPGYIDREMIEAVIGPVHIDPGLVPEAGEAPKAPGMKYRHYAPRARLTVVDGKREAVIQYINRQVQAADRPNENGREVRPFRFGVICSDETRSCYQADVIKNIGSRQDEEAIARHLYEVLRAFDEEGVDEIYSESFETPRMGRAIMNRLLKAAGYRVIKVGGGQQ